MRGGGRLISKVPLNFVRLNRAPILHQLWWEEKLLRGTDSNWCIVNLGAPDPAIVLGISGKPEKMCNLDLVNRDKIPMIKRFTGGGTVIVDEDTIFISLIMNKASFPQIEPFPRTIMDWTGEVYSPVFEKYLSPFSESFAVRENDYVLGDKKFGGNAQSIIKDRWLHHTSFLWDFKAKNMEYLQLPEKRPAYRASRDHGAFLTRLRDHFSTLRTPEAFLRALEESLSDQFSLASVSPGEAEALVRGAGGGGGAEPGAGCRTRLL